MARHHTREALTAAIRASLNDAQKATFDQCLATGTWQANKSITYLGKTVCWLQDKAGTYFIGINLEGKIERPLKGKKNVSFNSRTLERTY